jgi:hypothetical protein
MRTHYNCGECKILKEATEEHFFPSNLKKVATNPNRTTISKCKICANQYATQYHNAIKEKGLVRSQQNTLVMAGAVNGTIYVIGPDVPGTPYKIGITSGSNTDKRKTSLQTAHWMDLKLVWKSALLNRADIIEKKLHKHFEKQWVRGEWFNITKQDIESIPTLIKHFGVEE